MENKRFETMSLYGFAECVLELQETVCRMVSAHSRMVSPKKGFEVAFDKCQEAREEIQKVMQRIRYGEE